MPGGRHRCGVAAEDPVRRRVAVAGHHLQRPALQVGHREAVGGAPGRVMDGVTAGQRPLDGARRVHGHEPAALDTDDVQPVRRPARLRERTEPPRAPVRPHRVRAHPRDREHRAAPRKRREGRRGACVARGQAVADPAAHGSARRGQRDRKARGEQRGHERYPYGRAARRPRGDARGVLGERRLHHRPAASGRLRLARQRPVAQAVADGVAELIARSPRRAGRARGGAGS